MIGILVAVIVVVGIALLIALYTLLLTSIYPESIRTNEIYYVRTNDLWLLRVCRYRKSRATGEPVLLVHGMGANQNNFTCPENGSLVDYLREKGYDCWTVDLRGSRSSEPPFERTRDEVCMEDFFRDDLPSVLTHILKNTNYAKVHWVGHSMGGMLLYAYALHCGGEEIASGTTLGSPLDFSDAAGKAPTWVIAVGEKCPALAGTVIRSIVPIVKFLRLGSRVFPINHKNLPDSMTAGDFVNMLENPLPMLMWQVRHWIKSREYKLLNGGLDVPARIVDFPVPLLAFFAPQDPFIDIDRAKGWFESIKVADKKMVVCAEEQGFAVDYNHCDLAFSKAADKEVFEPILRWLEEHPAPIRAAIKKETERFGATTISDEKRAKILAGTAYAHVKEEEEGEETTDADVVETPPPDSDESVVTPEQTTETGGQEQEEEAPEEDDAVEQEKAPEEDDAVEQEDGDRAADAAEDAADKTPDAKTEEPAPPITAPKKKQAAQKSSPKKAATKKKSTSKQRASAKKKKTTKKTSTAKKKSAGRKTAKPSEKASGANKAKDDAGNDTQKQQDGEEEQRSAAFSELMASLSKPLDPESRQ